MCSARLAMSHARLFRRRGKMVTVLLAAYRSRGGRITQNANEMLVPVIKGMAFLLFPIVALVNSRDART